MKDINGIELAVGQIVVVPVKDQALANIPVLKKAEILDLCEEERNTYITIKYLISGRIVKIDGYLWLIDKRFCVIEQKEEES